MPKPTKRSSKSKAKPVKKRKVSKPSSAKLDFAWLVDAIRQIDQRSAAEANRVVNVSLTLRNWAIGGYIQHYELHGSDRASYGEGLMDKLSARLEKLKVVTCDRPRLYAYLSFYRCYPQVGEMLPSSWVEDSVPKLVSPALQIFRSLTGKSPTTAEKRIVRTASGQSPSGTEKRIVRTASGQLDLTGRTLVQRLSYSHLELLTAITDPLKRAFYEIECIRGNWAVRDLKRQIVTLYFERSGLSKDKDKLSAMVKAGIEPAEPKLAIRDPYIFEFLGLKAKDAVAESDLETALLDHLQDFVLELGHGFCLEARQKSIVIGKTRGFVDLVFYHRVLKCHVLMELKINEFSHEGLGQLNTYVNYFKKNMMTEGDNPPIGLLLCTSKDHALVEYAMAGMDNALFVSQYQLELPDRETLQRFLAEKFRELEG